MIGVAEAKSVLVGYDYASGEQHRGAGTLAPATAIRGDRDYKRRRQRSSAPVTSSREPATALTLGGITADVTIDIGGQQNVAAITRGSAEELALAEGDAVTVLIKATEVMLGK